jgi:hypothetical protein
MQGCRRLSHSRPEIDGLDDLLTAPEQQLHDIAIERERRRSRQGYATPADARAFLQMARQPRAASAPMVPRASDPIATAYFRALDEALDEDADTTPEGTSAGGPEGATHHGATNVPAHRDDDISTSVHAVVELLAEAARFRQGDRGQGEMPARPRALLEAAEEGSRGEKLPVLRRLTAFLLHHDETAYLARSRELAFLANALLAGSAVQSRPFTPREASDAAACTCNLGLEYWRVASPDAASPSVSPPRALDTAMLPDAFLVDHDLVTAFAAGWSVLYRDVSLFVADQLISTLADLPCVDADIRRGLRALRHMLVKQREAGTPWLARDAADVLAMLDMTAWISVLGLLDECPILPAALTAVLERRTTSVSPTAFEFISTTAQIGDVRLFMRALPGLLST